MYDQSNGLWNGGWSPWMTRYSWTWVDTGHEVRTRLVGTRVHGSVNPITNLETVHVGVRQLKRIQYILYIGLYNITANSRYTTYKQGISFIVNTGYLWVGCLGRDPAVLGYLLGDCWLRRATLLEETAAGHRTGTDCYLLTISPVLHHMGVKLKQ